MHRTVPLKTFMLTRFKTVILTHIPHSRTARTFGFLPQETDKETRSQNESLRAKLEQQRGELVEAQEQARRLQARVDEEKGGTAAQRAQLEAAQAGLREKEDALQLERVRS